MSRTGGLPAVKGPARRGAVDTRLAPMAAMCLGLLLGGCVSTGPAPIETATQSRVVPADQAFAVPQIGGPTVLTVLESDYANAVEQKIILISASGRPGQNFLDVQLFGWPTTGTFDRGTLDNALPNMTDIWDEMDDVLQGVGMVVSPYYVENRYGPFGYAVGRYSNDLCLYAWQRIGEADLNADRTSRQDAIAIRLRLCRTGATERQLLETMYGFTITAYYADGRWDPFGDAATLTAGRTIYPPQNVLSPPAAATTTTIATTPTTPAIVPTGPTVPLPPGAGGGGTTNGPIVPPPPQ